MYDKIDKIGKSKIQHGKNNNRIYLMSLYRNDYPSIINKMEVLAAKNNYTKIFTKIPGWAIDGFQAAGYLREASIPNFYNGEKDAHFFSHFIDHSRSVLDSHQREQINNFIALALSKKSEPLTIEYNSQFKIKILKDGDIPKLNDIYWKVFISYPFPIFEENYIKKTMRENVIYFGIFLKDKLIAASSAEMDVTAKNAEMTDFATIPDFRGNNLSLVLLNEMEKEMRRKRMKTLYTIARSYSAGMNITFAKMGYMYAGTLINNTQISTKIESMNVWYKNL